MSDSKISVVLADDHHIVVEGIREILKNVEGLEVVGVGYNGKELIKIARESKPDLAILDINMPEMDGLQCTRILKQEFPAIKVLILTMYNDRTFINEMINAGADGCVLKATGTGELRDAINRVLNNKSYFDALPQVSAVSMQEKVQLSDREIEIIKLVVKGKTSGEIADVLFISDHTVKTHRKNIFRKLQINHVSQLTSIAINRGWG
ncbi:MAG TPA: response regulator transcription factor [Chryseosolibacter sp.]|nr:response regulator transcription factor [Chryseosolibacter sp.]